jgi:hypothetical protein
MKIIRIKTFSGPSLLHNKPLLCARLDIGELEVIDSSSLPEFVERLLTVAAGTVAASLFDRTSRRIRRAP